jgi:hypothetical protein
MKRDDVYPCGKCLRPLSVREVIATDAGVRCGDCVPLTGRDQVQARRRLEAERKAWGRSAA